MGAATYFARMIVTPDRLRPDDIRILEVQDGSVTLELTEESGQPGRYGLWFDGGRGHARVGAVLDLDEASGSVHSVRSVRRVLEGVDHGELRPGPARWNGYFFGGDPGTALGLSFKNVQVESENGGLATWEVPGEASSGDRWAILVHGRGATREECLRAVPVLHGLGFTTLIPMYRNDLGAPSSSDGRYSLGLSEWRDLEAAILYAVGAGARDVVLFGWSMGGAIVLQTLDRSWLSDRVSAVVLDAPVVDWGDVLRHHGTLHRIPGTIAGLSRGLIGQRWARRLVGVHEPIDVAATNWEHRAEELRHRTLLIHSLDDEFVPAGPSISLAAKRPDLVRFEPWHLARHTREWNTDPERWDAVVLAFLTESGQDLPENPHHPQVCG
ncbi:MAG: alpha/beta fold hydrolase [Dermatophilaceae bacterium]|nr:alpha/beta fold hydrolase [Dermatophilaceae bacterium]